MSTNKESRRSFFQKSVATSIGLVAAPSLLTQCTNKTTPVVSLNEIEPEWRNKKKGMSYRMLGRTGLMVSELVLGTFHITDKKYFPVIDAGIERGMNYLDTASAYSKGKVETTLGGYLKDSGNREKIFLSTKLSSYYNYISAIVDDILKGLPEGKRKELEKKVREQIAERGITKPGYHINYFGGQEGQFKKTYLRHLVLKEYGYKKEWRNNIKAYATKKFEEGLQRLQTDYVDILHCPHGIAMPEMLDDEILKEVFESFKQKGQVRFSGVSFHNDVTGNLTKAMDVGYIDMVMFAYNIANHAALDRTMYEAKLAGLGLVAMKVGKLFSLRNQPEWRAEKLNEALPDEQLSLFAKSYLWALQNPNLTCCASQMETMEQLEDNFSVIGRKVNVKSL